jgi:hypothetical protein
VQAGLQRSQAQGAAGLVGQRGRPGGGARRPVPPPSAAAAKAVLEEVIQRSPRLFGLARRRWWLDGLRRVVPWLAGRSRGAGHGLLRRLGVASKRASKRGRRYGHAPDPDYEAKLAVVAQAQARAHAADEPDPVVFLDQDESQDESQDEGTS